MRRTLSAAFGCGDRDSTLDGLSVIGLEGDELEVVRLEGRIERLMAEVFSEDPASASRLVDSVR